MLGGEENGGAVAMGAHAPPGQEQPDADRLLDVHAYVQAGSGPGGKELGQTANLQPPMLWMIKEKEAPASIAPFRPLMGTTRNLKWSVVNQKTIDDSPGVHAKLTPTATLCYWRN